MIIRVRFIEAVGNRNVIHTWCLFMVPETNTLLETFDGIYLGKYSCGRALQFESYDSEGVMCSIVSSKSAPSNDSEMMPSPLSIRLCELKENGSSLFVQFELQQKKTSECDPDDINDANETTEESNEQQEVHADTITVFLMNRQNCYVNKKSNAKNGDNQQFNALLDIVKEKKCGVRPTSLVEFTKCLQLFSDLLWEVDPHYDKIKAHASRFPDIVEKRLMGFNNPKFHGHSVKAMNISSIISKITKLATYLERKFMLSSHMKPLEDIISSVSRCICKYNDYLQAQRISNSRLRENEDLPDDSVEDFSVRIIRQLYDYKPYMKNLSALKTTLESTDAYVPININDYVHFEQRQSTYELMKSIREVGFPTISGDFDIFYFRLPSQGPHSSVNFLWKAVKDSSSSDAENTKIVLSLRGRKKNFYSRASKRAVKNTLYRIGITKPHKAEYLLRTLLGDASAPHDLNQASILQRFDQYVSLGEDIICDLRENNGRIPKYDAFWDIVDEYIQNKTAIDDRRHGSEVDGEIVVTMAIATSYADLYRQCVKIAASKNPPVEVPSKQWFMLQFWPSSKTLSGMTHYTGRFKVKRMVQARILRKKNVDSHYTNAIYSFLKERAVKHSNSTAMISADAKCKVSVGEPDFPIASVSRGKVVIVGKNEKFKVVDHDFSKVSVIPDAILVHSIPEEDRKEDGEDTECNKDTVGKWYRGKVFYGVKYMATQGSSAMRGATELSMAMEDFYGPENIPPRLYLYTDGGGDRKNTNFKVQKGLISLFLHHDLDEVVAARPAAGHSYRNPVERCHCIANLGLQSVGMMRTKQSIEFERTMKNVTPTLTSEKNASTMNFLRRNLLSLCVHQKNCSKKCWGICILRTYHSPFSNLLQKMM